MAKAIAGLILIALASVLGLANYYIRQTNTATKQNIADLQQQVSLHLRENKLLNDRNDALRIEVENLRSPDSYFSYEEKAREDYGLIGSNETYFILSDTEIAALPDIQALSDNSDTGDLYSSSMTVKNITVNSDKKADNNVIIENTPLKLESLDSKEDTSAKQTTIPITPVPLQLESLQ